MKENDNVLELTDAELDTVAGGDEQRYESRMLQRTISVDAEYEAEYTGGNQD